VSMTHRIAKTSLSCATNSVQHNRTQKQRRMRSRWANRRPGGFCS
jgi:hypothetical protein